MKIGHIILTSQNGGAEQVFIDYIRILKKIGHQNFAVIKKDAPYFNALDNLGVEYLKINNQLGYFDFLAIKKISDFIIKNDIDILIAHAGKSIILGHKAIKRISKNHKKIILVAVNHSNNIKRSLVADLILSVNREIFFKTIDSNRTVNDSLILYNGLDISSHVPNFLSYDFTNQAEINIGLIGRFHKAKGFDFAIDAFKIVKEKTGLNIKLKIAGSGEEEENLRKKVNDLELKNDVKFLGWIKNSTDFFNEIDIFILPSKVETFGLVILEAMKNCKPIIATNCDGPNEILRQNIDALIVNQNSEKGVAMEIANALERLIYDKELANNLVRSAYNRLEARFSEKILEQNLAEIFKI